MTPTIVCAIEPGTAERVARAGGELARGLGARLVLAPVRDDPPLFNSKMERERARNRSRRRGRAILRRAHAALPADVDADDRIEVGVAVTGLTEIADEVDAALIVVGTRRRGRLTSALLGSVSQTLVRQAPCPVMIVPDNQSADTRRRFDETPPERSTIVAGVDGSAESSEATRLARELAERLGDRLVIVPTHAAAEPPAPSPAPAEPRAPRARLRPWRRRPLPARELGCDSAAAARALPGDRHSRTGHRYGRRRRRA